MPLPGFLGVFQFKGHGFPGSRKSHEGLDDVRFLIVEGRLAGVRGLKAILREEIFRQIRRPISLFHLGYPASFTPQWPPLLIMVECSRGSATAMV